MSESINSKGKAMTATFQGALQIDNNLSEIAANDSQIVALTNLGGASITQVQSNSFNYATMVTASSGASGMMYTATYDPPITKYLPGQVLWFDAPLTNTGPTTFNSGAGAMAINGADGLPLQGLEIVSATPAAVIVNVTASAFRLINPSGAYQVAPAVYSLQAPQWGQVQALQGNFKPLMVNTDNTATLTSLQFGSFVEFAASTASTITLPSPFGAGGATFHLWNNSGSIITLYTPVNYFYGIGTVYSGNGTNMQTLAPNEVISITSDAYNWIVPSRYNQSFACFGSSYYSLTMYVNTTYTNTYGKPIYVHGQLYAQNNINVQMLINGNNYWNMDNVNSDGTWAVYPNFSFVVPAGATYELYVATGTATVAEWSELR